MTRAAIPVANGPEQAKPRKDLPLLRSLALGAGRTWHSSRRLRHMAITGPKYVILSLVVGLSVAGTAVHAQDQNQPSLSVFDAAGKVDRFALFDFKDLPLGKTRVRQFDLPDTRCSDIGRVLINGAASCKGPSLKGTECMDHLDLKSSSSMEIVG